MRVAARGAKEGSMVVPTVKDTRVAASSMLEGMRCGCTAEMAMAPLDAAWLLKFGTPRAWRSLPGDYEDAALRLKNGSCEDDEPSQVFRIALPRARGEHGRPDRVSHSRDSLIDDRTPLCA